MSKQKDVKEEMWQCEFSQEEIEGLDLDKLKFALEESRAYLENISEKINRLSNKGFILAGLVGGITGFLVSRVLDLALDPTQGGVSAIQHHWSAVLLALFCLGCLLDAFWTLIGSVVSPIGFRPIGTYPKNLLHKGVLTFSLKSIMVRQMECYQTAADDNIAKIKQMALSIRRCLRLVFVYPVLAILAWLLLTYCVVPLLQ